ALCHPPTQQIGMKVIGARNGSHRHAKPLTALNDFVSEFLAEGAFTSPPFTTRHLVHAHLSTVKVELLHGEIVEKCILTNYVGGINVCSADVYIPCDIEHRWLSSPSAHCIRKQHHSHDR